MTYKVGDYLERPNTVFMRVIASIQGEFEIYGISSIKNPIQLDWFTLQELNHLGYKKSEPNVKEFNNAKIGDIVHAGGDQYLKVLAKAGHALLLSQASDEIAKIMLEIGEQFNDATGQQVMSREQAKFLKQKSSKFGQLNNAGTWFDVEVMALMAWKLIKE